MIKEKIRESNNYKLIIQDNILHCIIHRINLQINNLHTIMILKKHCKINNKI